MKNSDFNITDHRVKGHADLGTFVSYHDIANQTGDVYEVLAFPERDPIWGWESGYSLRHVETGDLKASDLRQHGWTFAKISPDLVPAPEDTSLAALAVGEEVAVYQGGRKIGTGRKVGQKGDLVEYEVTITEPGAAFRVIDGGAYGITFKLPENQ